MTNKSIRDYINLIESVQRENMAEGSDELYQQAIRKYVQRVANNYLGGGNAHLYGAGNFDSDMFGVDPKQAEQDFDRLFPEYLKKLQGGKSVSEDGIESWSGNPSDRRHSGHSSYMTPEYMLAHYKERLAQIAAGKHKYPKEVAQLQAKIAKLEKQVATEEQVEESSPESIAKIEQLTRK
jgi:hypothetical protein